VRTPHRSGPCYSLRLSAWRSVSGRRWLRRADGEDTPAARRKLRRAPGWPSGGSKIGQVKGFSFTRVRGGPLAGEALGYLRNAPSAAPRDAPTPIPMATPIGMLSSATPRATPTPDGMRRKITGKHCPFDGKTTCMVALLLLSSHFYPPIEGLALGGSVVSNRPRFTITNRGEALCRYAVLGHPCDD